MSPITAVPESAETNVKAGDVTSNGQSSKDVANAAQKEDAKKEDAKEIKSKKRKSTNGDEDVAKQVSSWTRNVSS